MRFFVPKASALLLTLTTLAGVALANPSPQPAGSDKSMSAIAAVPATLRPALFDALGQDFRTRYPINADGCAAARQGSIKGCFDARGAVFGTGDSQALKLRLTTFGRTSDLAAMAAIRPHIADNTASYVHDNVTEWWRILPIGYEQGFTITRRPAGNGQVALALTSSRAAKKQGDGLAWGKLNYGSLVVNDATGRRLPATLSAEGHRILISVNDADASYPITVDPLLWQEQETTADDGAAGDQFGISVAISGNTAFIGADDATINGNAAQGAVYVFSNTNGTWVQSQKITLDDGASGDFFGVSVTIDGENALIGAHGTTVDGNAWQGAAYIFTNVDGVWTRSAKITANDGAFFDQFGWAVALSGTSALVAAQNATVGANANQGAVYAFSNSGGVWSQTQKLVADDGAASAYFGFSIALSGTTALIGAEGDGDYMGAAYVFDSASGVWTQTQKLTADDADPPPGIDQFGRAVALSGTTALIGSEGDNVHGNQYQGAAYIFTSSSGVWSQTQKLIASDGEASDLFGSSVALVDGNALIGAFGATVDGNADSGAAYIFENTNGAWNEISKIVASDGVYGLQFGSAVAIDAAFHPLIAAWSATVNGNTFQGAAYFYSNDDIFQNGFEAPAK